MIREESSDWISTQVVHQVSPYVVSENSGRLSVENVVLGYHFNLPRGFRTVGARKFILFLEKENEQECAIKHYNLAAEKAKTIVSDGQREVVLFNNSKLIFESIGTSVEKDICSKYLKDISQSVLFDE
jgi:hypothetical protein